MKLPAILQALLVATMLTSAYSVNTCGSTFGSTATCIEETACTPGLGGVVSGQCLDAGPTVKCCLNFKMTNAFQYFNSLPWQVEALDRYQAEKLQSYPDVMKSFACKYRNKTPDGSWCGSVIRMSDVAKYYSNLAHQVGALDYLQSSIETNNKAKPADHISWQNFVKMYRNTNGAVVGGPVSTGSGCNKNVASALSLSKSGLGLITHFEGWYSCCYRDTEGIFTIGYGHACHVNSNDGSGCGTGNTCSGCITRAKGEEILARDMAQFVSCVRNYVKVPVSQNQFDALVSFAFNVGCGALSESTLLAKLNAGNLSAREAQVQFTRWHSGCTEGLKRRRFAEAELFNSCSSSFPCSYNSCEVSYGYTQCSGTCSHCSRCGGCSSSATAEALSVEAQEIESYLLAEVSQGSAVNETSTPDAADSWACNSTKSSCKEQEDVLPGSFDTATAPASTACSSAAPRVTKSILLESYQWGDLSRIHGDGLQIELTLAKLPFHGTSARLDMEIFAASEEIGNQIKLVFERDALPVGGNLTDAEETSERMVIRQISTSNNPKNPNDPTVAVSGAPALIKPSTIFTASVVATSVVHQNRLALASAAVLLLLPSVNGQPIRTCSPVVKLTLQLDPADYSYLLALIESKNVTLSGVTNFQTTSAPVSLKDCVDPAFAFQYPATCLDPSAPSAAAGITAPLALVSNPFLLENAFKFYDAIKYPHQKCALEQFQAALSSPSFSRHFNAFACGFRNKSPTVNDPACGNPIKLIDVAQYYNNEKWQVDAMRKLQVALEAAHSGAWQTLVAHWRQEKVCVFWNILATGRCGPTFANAGCDPEYNPCCSAAGWCGATDNHCKNGGKDWRFPYAAAVPANPVEISGGACAGNHPATGKPGVCISVAKCAAVTKAESVSGLCPNDPNDVKCCSGPPEFVKVKYSSNSALCGAYEGDQTFQIAGNGGTMYTVVKLKREHLVEPSYYDYAPNGKDNSIEVTAACAYDKMRAAAWAAGAYIKVTSGFRVLERQQYFYNCMNCQCCNGGSLAAVPGSSNHGRGKALDLNTDCGRQSGPRPDCGYSKVYQWLYNNAHNFGFYRTVQSEPWHWEYAGFAPTQRTWYS